jgi:hypothetical protein
MLLRRSVGASGNMSGYCFNVSLSACFRMPRSPGNHSGLRLPGHRRCLSIRFLRQCGTRLLAAHRGRFNGLRAWHCGSCRRMRKLFPLGGASVVCRVDRKGESQSSQLPACAPHWVRRHGSYLSLVDICGSEPLTRAFERQRCEGGPTLKHLLVPKLRCDCPV